MTSDRAQLQRLEVEEVEEVEAISLPENAPAKPEQPKSAHRVETGVVGMATQIARYIQHCEAG